MFLFLHILNLNLFALFLCFTLTIIVYYLTSKPSRKIFLLDFACFKPPINQAMTKEAFIKRLPHCFNFEKETLSFLKKVVMQSGIGDSTYVPPSYIKDPVDFSLEGARIDVEMATFGVVDELLAKTKLKREDIGILVVNCCVFSVTPSIASMIVNRYKLRGDIVSYNLSGMGCSASLIAITLAEQLLQVHHDTYALIVSTEVLTHVCHRGNDLSKLLVSGAFRVGGSAILLSNHASDIHSSKYQLIHTVRNNTSSADISYGSIIYEEDEKGYGGITVTRVLLSAAVKTIKSNITSLASQVLPLSEKLRYILTSIALYTNLIQSKLFVPNFKNNFNHILPHVGGKPVLDELENTFKLPKIYMEASRMTLYRFGNTSSSSVWYELAYVEAKNRIKRGDRVWQMAFGSGFKSCSLVWRAIKTVEFEEINPWRDEIDKFPVDLSKMYSDPEYFKSTSN